MKKIIAVVVLILISAPLYAEIIDNGDSTVTDTVSGLMWRKYDNGSNVSYSSATIYIENLNYGKYSNWRFPTWQELSSFYRRQGIYNYSSFTNVIDSYSQIPQCYGCLSSTNCMISYCNSTHISPVRNPQYDIDKIFTQAQMDTAVQMAITQERSRWDADGDNKIGIEEAIRALQIISGAR